MPLMETLHHNLDRLMSAITQWQNEHGVRREDRHMRTADIIADKMPLAHSTSSAAFISVVNAGEMLSHRLRNDLSEEAPKESAETRLNTDNAVFLFVGPFSYRLASPCCGFLLEATLEEQRQDDGEASPFDSGGLIQQYQRNDTSETPLAFLDRHRLPLTGHRRYLKEKLVAFFNNPVEYLYDVSVSGAACNDEIIGLTGGDRRRWTHEVRINDTIELHAQLLAVFLPAKVVRRVAQLKASLYANLGDRFVIYRESEGAFDAMQDACIAFLETYLDLES